jgi:hypothetical protein
MQSRRATLATAIDAATMSPSFLGDWAQIKGIFVNSSIFPGASSQKVSYPLSA